MLSESFLALSVGLFSALPAAGAGAGAAPRSHADTPPSGPSLSARAGYAYFVNARSLALEHRVKPSLRVNVWWPTWVRIDVGAGATGVLADANYGVWGGYAFGRYRIVDQALQLSTLLGVGLGHNAPILHGDLQANGPVLPYGYLGVEALYTINDTWRVGAELSWESLSVLHFGFALGYSLP